MQTYTYRKKRTSGFSLVELLVVITVIGVIAAIAIPSLGFAHENSRVAIAKRNAQQISSTFGSGETTGAPAFVAANSLESAVNAVGAGSWGAGIYHETYFQVPGVSYTMDDAKPVAEQAVHYLSWTGTSLIYNEDGGAPAAPPVDNRPWSDGPPEFSPAMAQHSLAAVLASSFANTMEFRISPTDPRVIQYRTKK